MPTAQAGFTVAIIERIIDTDPLTINASVTSLQDVDGGSVEVVTAIPPFRGTVELRSNPAINAAMGDGVSAEIQTSREYVLVASRTAGTLGEVTPERNVRFTHPTYGELRVTNIHATRVSGEVCGYFCTLAQVR
jgi:hypothetical protein